MYLSAETPPSAGKLLFSIILLCLGCFWAATFGQRVGDIVVLSFDSVFALLLRLPSLLLVCLYDDTHTHAEQRVGVFISALESKNQKIMFYYSDSQLRSHEHHSASTFTLYLARPLLSLSVSLANWAGEEGPTLNVV